ncbi:MAG: AMP-binding protein [Acidimicrobiales bacterium]|nr:AMP-binding protein [Acidimicrobiales bacterium]
MTALDLARHGLVPMSRPPRPVPGPATVAELLDAPLAADPDRVLLVGRHGRHTAQGLDQAVRRAATALRGLGLGAGDRIAVSLPNDDTIVVAFLAAMRLGAVWVGLNRPLAAPEKAYMLRDAQVSVFLGDAVTAREVGSCLGELPDLGRIVRVDPDGDDEWSGLLVDDDPGPLVPVDPFAPAAIAYTSGTTGFPKGAVHTQHNLLLPGRVSARRAPVPSAQQPATPVMGVPLPLTILNLMILGPLAAYQSGAAVVAMDRIDAVGMAEWIRDERVTTFAAVPAMVHDLLTHPEVTDEMLESIEAIGVGGADMPDAFRRLYEERFGRRVGTGYGLTEAPTSVTGEDVNLPPVPGTCGRALPQIRIHILGDDGIELAAGEVGEVCVGPSDDGDFADTYRPMLGYWNRPEETATALRGGLLHTGDIGVLDEEGNLFIKDRRNDLVIRGGANVYPAEVERVLHDAAGVAACAVIGEPDDRLGERVVAFVERAPGATVDEAALLAHCRANLARYKVPESITFVAGFDRTPMGKIRKTALRDGAARLA